MISRWAAERCSLRYPCCFGAAGIAPDNIAFLRDTFTFRYPGPPSEFLGLFRAYYGPTMNAFEAAAKNGKEADLQRELEQLFVSHNQSGRPDQTVISATFLRVSVSVRNHEN